MTDSDFVAFVRVAHRVMGEYLAEIDGSRAGAPARRASAAVPAAPPATAGNGDRGPATTGAAGRGSRFDEVQAALLRQMIERTGYPAEMLELDLDLEGELGIDTVKQVAAISAVREQYRLDVDPNFRLRDYNTLRKVITHIAERLERATA